MRWQTHTVFNQPLPLNNSNLFLSDASLRDAVAREGAGWDVELLASIGQQLGTAESLELGRLANVNPPELLRYDATGERLDDVRCHPAWHLLMQGLCANRVHNLAWEDDARAGAYVARAARFVLHAQVEAGTLCPVTMTFAATPLLQQTLPTPFRDWLKPLLSDRYDPHVLPGGQKRGLLIGMGMTEKQGGSDVLSNTTRAEKAAIFTGWWATNGFSRCRKAMRIWCWRRRAAVCPASSCRVFCRTARATACVLNGLKTSSATAQTPAAKWNFRRPAAGCWGKRATVYGRS